MLKYQRALQRIRNRKAALRKKPASSSSSSPSFNARPSRLFEQRDDNDEEEDEEETDPTEEAPVQFDDLLFLDPREQRAVMRDQFSQAVKLAPKKLDVILVRLAWIAER